MATQFRRALEKAGYHSRKQDGVYKRREITFHSFRRFVKTTITNKARNSDYSEWFIGHTKSTYYVNKPSERRKIYEQDCMRFLSFLDFKSMEEIGRDIKSELNAKIERLEEKNKQLEEIIEEYKNNKGIGVQSTTAVFREFEQTQKQMGNKIKELEELIKSKKK
jgi:hypothetical protein